MRRGPECLGANGFRGASRENDSPRGPQGPSSTNDDPVRARGPDQKGREALTAAGGIAGNTKHVPALDATIETASGILVAANAVDRKLATVVFLATRLNKPILAEGPAGVTTNLAMKAPNPCSRSEAIANGEAGWPSRSGSPPRALSKAMPTGANARPA